MTTKVQKMEKSNLVRFLAILGAIVAIIETILSFAGLGIGRAFFVGAGSVLISIVVGIIVILLALLILRSTGTLGRGQKRDGNALFTLIIGIIVFILGAWIGGIILIIAGIVDIIK